MTIKDIAAALQRAAAVLQRRPSAGVHDDAPGQARWLGGLRIETRHANGRRMLTDVAQELGGDGDQVSPGWMVRSGVAACTATSIASVAALEGIELEALEVEVTSRSDARGYLGLTETNGAPIGAGPLGMEMRVRLSAPGVAPERLRELVSIAQQRAPMTAVVQESRRLDLHVEVGGAG